MRLKIFLIALVVMAADQATKAWMSSALDHGHVIHVMPGLAWELSHNNGAAFGALEGGNFKLIVAATFAIGLLLFWVRQVNSTVMATALGLLLGGAVGNLIDRVRLGHVVDFIAIQSGGRTVFPNFNVADSAITVGACLLAYSWYRLEQRSAAEDEGMASTSPSSSSHSSAAGEEA